MDEATALEELAKLESWMQERKIAILGQIKSPVKGSYGNQEYLIYLDLSAVAGSGENSQA